MQEMTFEFVMAQLYSSEEVNVWHRAAPKITAMDSSDVGVSDGHSRWPMVALQHFFGECSLTLKYHACHMMLDFIYSIVMYCLVFHFKHG